MRRLRGVLLVLLVGLLAPMGWAQEAKERFCQLCEAVIMSAEDIVWYGGKVFCSVDCRAEQHADSFRCKICNERCEPSSGPAVRSDGYITYIQISPPRWDGYCDFCRQGVKDGTIVPVTDRYRPPRDENPVSVPAAPAGEGQASADTEDEEEEDEEGDEGGWALEWVVSLVVFLLLLSARLFK